MRERGRKEEGSVLIIWKIEMWYNIAQMRIERSTCINNWKGRKKNKSRLATCTCNFLFVGVHLAVLVYWMRSKYSIC